MKKRLAELEYLAWRLVCHEHNRCEREETYQCSELQQIIDYFESHGVPYHGLAEEHRSPASEHGVKARA